MPSIIREKPMRRITSEEKKEKSGSIECFRGVQFVSFIASCVAASFSTHSIMTNTATQHSWSFILTAGALLFGLFSTARIRSLREVVNLYWEQQSSNENAR